MKAFEYINARDLKAASQALGSDPGKAKILAGGMDLLTELKEHLIEPERIVNIKGIKGLDVYQVGPRGARLGALITLSRIEADKRLWDQHAALAEAARAVGSPQIRNVGTLGGNLCQRPRCWYYRDEQIRCIKKGGSKCFAADEQANNKYNAILGAGPSWIVHPSDCATALVALGAKIRYFDAQGKTREVLAEEFFVLPKVRVNAENILQPNEILTEVILPAPRRGTRSTYLKFRERESFDWALSAVAVSAQVTDDGTIQEIRVVLGGVAPAPWRSLEAEKVLQGQKYSPQRASQAAEAALEQAAPLSQNAYKVPLTKVLIRRAVEKVVTGKATPV
ncbi:MAG: FAD binding domain-containing protein [Armatimonadetes bacterium]|nr:FAD binding domain-containing protein [Armatimonadota bacterium]